MAGLVHFPGFRRYDEARVAANDSMVALLLGVEAVQHELSQTPMQRGQSRLSESMPHLSSAARLDQRLSRARVVLDGAERHLAYMTIPYVLSVYERFLLDAVEMARSDGRDLSTGGVKLSALPGHLEDVLGIKLERDYTELFAAINVLRNRLVHHGGIANGNLRSAWGKLTKKQRDRWEAFAGHPIPQIEAGHRLELGAGELFGVLAVTLHLAWELNRALQHTLSRDYWARLVAADFAALNPRRFNDPTRRLAGTCGYARTLYRALSLSEEEIARNLP